MTLNKRLPFKYVAILLVYLIVASVILHHYMKPFYAERHFRDGYNFGVLKRYRYAIEELEKAIVYAPWETHYMVQLGKYYEDYANHAKTTPQKLKLLHQAEDLYKRMIVLDHLNPWYRNRLALVHLKFESLYPEKKDFYKNSAFENIKKAAQLDSQNPLFQINYASYLHRNNQLDEAIPYYLRTIEIDRDIPEAYFNLADIHRRKGDLDQTLSYYLKLYEINPTFRNISLAIASTYLSLDKGQEAIPYLEQTLKDNPKQLEPLKSLASLYVQNKTWLKAAITFEYLFTTFPDAYPEGKVFFIQALANSGQVDKALSYSKKYMKEYSKTSDIYIEIKKMQPTLHQAKQPKK